jgi:hypothetical protein
VINYRRLEYCSRIKNSIVRERECGPDDPLPGNYHSHAAWKDRRLGWPLLLLPRNPLKGDSVRGGKEHLLVSKVLPIFGTSYYFCVCSDLSLL